MTHKDKGKALQSLVRYSLLASITTLLQISVVLLPGVGHILGAFNTLPIAIATYISPQGGILCYLVSLWLTLVIAPSETPLLALCTAPLGVFIGWGLTRSFPKSGTIVIGTISFTIGMFLITKLLGIPAFGPVLAGNTFTTMLLFYAGFSFVYSWAWFGLVEKVIRQLQRLGVKL